MGADLMLPDSIFFDEARDNLAEMERALQAVGSQDDERELVHSIFRRAHSIKGAAAVFGMTELANLMHQAESVLDLWRCKRVEPDRASTGMLLEAVALARQYLSDDAVQKPLLTDLAGRLHDLVGSDAPRPNRRLVQVVIEPHSRPGLANVVPELFRDIAGLGEVVGESRGQGGRLVYSINTDTSDAELLDLIAMHVDRDQFVVQAAHAGSREAQVDADTSGVPVRSSGVRVSRDELDGVIRIGKQLEEVGARIADSGRRLAIEDGADLPSDVLRLQEYTAQLQRAVQNMRTAPVLSVFDPVRRLLQGLSIQLGKQFKLVTAGEDMRVDRFMAQGLADLVIHLVRNSCDHGIEAPDERIAAGKRQAGLIGLEATDRDGVVQIVVGDDGRGLSRERLLLAARASGLDVSDAAPDDEVWQLVFVPGFSTAGVVSQISGRGVGMDLVRRKVSELGGSVEIASSEGAGTRVTIKLPAAVGD